MSDPFMRCKFKVNSIEYAGAWSSQGPGVKVKMGAVYDGKPPENEIFGKYTPHGAFEATIFNENLVALLPTLIGKSVYLDFTEAPE